ncbi:hypothetical protein OOT00_08230 [Desulfobotulus sp. H1]|uniref:Uncharacterized protein n=1 Tax=Desulfobotulus pelophilus TaxID=2823377 RepID=A0ABT3N931_9BACT|nr:hypothetical protein [Desulfobotulus pelophilus]MCW7753971.1 hypothetical protein [Desulfobotulus pelophilus]
MKGRIHIPAMGDHSGQIYDRAERGRLASPWTHPEQVWLLVKQQSRTLTRAPRISAIMRPAASHFLRVGMDKPLRLCPWGQVYLQ